LVDTVRGLAEQTEKKRQAELRTMFEQQKVAAIQRLENARIDWIQQGRIDKEGTGGYRDEITSIIGGFQLTPDDITSLTQEYYKPALDYAKQTEANRIDTAEKVATQQRRITAAGLLGKLSDTLGGLASSVGLPDKVVEYHYGKIEEATTEYMSNAELPILDRLSAVADAYEAVNKVMSERNADTSLIQQQLVGLRATTQFANELQQQVLDGQISITDYNHAVEMEALANNVKGFKVPDPLAPTKFIQEVQQTQENLRELKQRREISQIEMVAADSVVIGSLATEFALNPVALAAVEASDPKRLDKNAKAALAIVKDFNKWRYDEVPAYNRRMSNLNTDMMEIKREFQVWYTRAVNSGLSDTPQVNKTLETLRTGGVTPELLQTGRLTQEQLNLVQQATSDVLKAKTEEGAALQQEFAVNQQRFNAVGLFYDVNTTKEAHGQFAEQRKRYNEQLQQIQSFDTPIPGAPPNFSKGNPDKPANWNPLSRQKYGGQSITLPFPQGITVPELYEGQQYGARRPGRTHGGLDFAVGVGTPVVSLVSGEVTEARNAGDYGLGVEVKGDDGFIYYFAHLSKSEVQVGQRVQAGQKIALSGNTGVGSGPHLHLEVGQGNKFNTIDPLGHLASRQFGVPPKGRRTSASPHARTTVPNDAIPLGGGNYLKDGRVIKATGVSQSSYNRANPVRNSRASRTSAPDDIEGNYGYGALAQDRDLRAAVTGVARNLNIPPQWLADVIAHESAGTFSPSIGNGLGYYGLIQIGEEARKDLGITVEQLRSMTAAQQMSQVEKYIKLQMRYAGVKSINSIDMLSAAVFLGHTGLRDVWENGQKAVSYNEGDSGGTLKDYLNSLGKYVGRKYNHLGGRKDKFAPIHTSSRQGCITCNQLLSQAVFTPHEALYG
jgi:murein DD-endopeptidase MepM/ murein hydrolase activator NlpD